MGAGRSIEVFGILFWSFLVIGLIVAGLGFASMYRRRDDRDGRY